MGSKTAGNQQLLNWGNIGLKYWFWNQGVNFINVKRTFNGDEIDGRFDINLVYHIRIIRHTFRKSTIANKQL